MSLAERYGPRPWLRRLRCSDMPNLNPASNETTVTYLINVIKLTDNPCRPYRRKNRKAPFRWCTDGIDCDEVYPNIFIGDGVTAKNKAYLMKLGITHILNAAEGNRFSMVNTDKYFYHYPSFKYLGLPLLDLPTTNISIHFNEVSDFIEDAIMNNGKVYVHCFMGMSRSSTCVIAYLMIKRGMTAAEAITLLRQSREIVPNVGFLQQLADLDNRLRAEREHRY